MAASNDREAHIIDESSLCVCVCTFLFFLGYFFENCVL